MNRSEWTVEDVAARFEEAARTGSRLPPVRVQGYYNLWPQILREPWERLAAEDRRGHRLPPTPEEVERMLETMRWVHWLEVDQRHLVWMRSDREPWRNICKRLGCDRTTAWRRWRRALEIVAEKLNGEGLRAPSKILGQAG